MEAAVGLLDVVIPSFGKRPKTLVGASLGKEFIAKANE